MLLDTVFVAYYFIKIGYTLFYRLNNIGIQVFRRLCDVMVARIFNMPTSYQWWVWEREAHINWSLMTCQGSTCYWNYFKVYWPCSGGLSAVNAIGTQLRDPINSGLARWRMVVLNKLMDAAAELGRNIVSKHQIQPEYGDEQADAGRDCRTRLARPNFQARTGTGKYSFSPSS